MSATTLTGRTVVVTGAAAGVGRGIALACAAAGAHVVVASRRVNGVEVVDEIEARGDAASWAQLFLKYLIGEPAITCVIPATRNSQHMGDDLKAGFGRLPDAGQRRQIRQFWDSL